METIVQPAVWLGREDRNRLLYPDYGLFYVPVASQRQEVLKAGAGNRIL